MSQKTVTQLQTETQTNIIPNGMNLITAQILQDLLVNMNDSFLNEKDGGTIDQFVYFVTGKGIDAVATAGTDTLNIGTVNADIVEIGKSGGLVSILSGYFDGLGLVTYQEKTIRTENGGGQIDLDYLGTPDSVVISNDSGVMAASFIYLQSSGIGIGGSGINASTVPYLDASKFIKSSSITPTELGYLSGVTSGIQAQINSLQTGQFWKAAVRVATTAAGTLASSFENGDTVDGVVLTTGDRILIKNQASGIENGIYTVNASGAPTRATDFDAGADNLSGATVTVQEGTANAETKWTCSTNNPITIGATSITFIDAGGVAYLGTTDRITVAGNIIDIAATYVGQISITTLGTVGTGIWQGTAVGIAYGGTNSSAALNNNRMMISSGGAIVEHAAQSQAQLAFYDSNGLPTGSASLNWIEATKKLNIGLWTGASSLNVLAGSLNRGIDVAGALGDVFLSYKDSATMAERMIQKLETTTADYTIYRATGAVGAEVYTEALRIANATGNITLQSLAGTGDRMVVANATGVLSNYTGTQATTLLDVFTSALKGLAPASGGGTVNFLRADGTWATPPDVGVTTLAAIGAIPNANGATISGATINLQPASASYGGVITTIDQTFAGIKTFDGINIIPITTDGIFIDVGAGLKAINITGEGDGVIIDVDGIPLRLGASSATLPTLVEGDVYNHPTSAALIGYFNGLKQSYTGVIYEQHTAVTHANSLTETTLLSSTFTGTKTLRANYFSVGEVLWIKAGGIYSATASPTLTIKIAIGASVASEALTMANVTDEKWEINIPIFCTATGASGNVLPRGWIEYQTALLTVVKNKFGAGNMAIDTTVQNIIDITADWSAAAAGNTITCDYVLIERKPAIN